MKLEQHIKYGQQTRLQISRAGDPNGNIQNYSEIGDTKKQLKTAENSCCTGCGLTLRPSLGRRRGLLRGASAQGLLVPSRTDPKSCDHTRGAALGMKTMLGLSIVQQWSSKQRKESIAGVSHCGFQDASR